MAGRTHRLESSVTREIIRNEQGEVIWTLRYSYAGDSTPVSMNVNGTEYYYLKNAQGDITHIVDGEGSEVAAYEYDAWGSHLKVVGGEIAQLNPYRYRGYRYDEETGLYFLESRYYSPEWGRFISYDPLLRTDHLIGMNAYLYCDNNPVNLVDEDGNHPVRAFHHEFVVFWLAGSPTSPLCGAIPNVTIRGGGRLPYTNGYADLIHLTGVYEVKPEGSRYMDQAKKQLLRYTGGEHMGTLEFTTHATNGGYNYKITAHGDGVITYTYSPSNLSRLRELDSCRTRQSIKELVLAGLTLILEPIFDVLSRIPVRGGIGGGGAPDFTGLRPAFR